ncbi:MAG: DNA-binding response regulator, partial [Verrucomicrobiales bacterium 32-60-5]
MKKVLVIEDHAMMRRNVLVILEMEGYQVASASNGREGLALVSTEQPDLILCDVMMPELDGHAVLRALRASPLTASVPFIFLTAKGEKIDQRTG